MRQLTVPAIEDPERFFPDPVLVRSPKVERLSDGYGRFWREDRDGWERIHPICLDIIAGLEKGLGWEALVADLPEYPSENIRRKAAEKLARQYCWKLHRLGYVRIDLEAPPAVFHGRYRFVKELGRGGLGVANLCEDLQDGDRLVVVKHPWGIKTDITKGQKALAIEIELQSELRHPAIPRIVDHFEVRGLLHLVRDYVDGRKLGSLTGPLVKDRPRRVRIVRQVAEALHYIHQAGYLFFDPSPENFFLTGDDKVMLTDLGGAKHHTDRKVRVTGPRGTPGYVAPELRLATKTRPQLATVRSDAWAFGCLYYALTLGRRPRRLWKQNEIVASLDERPIPEQDRLLIATCCQDDPDARPASFADILPMLV